MILNMKEFVETCRKDGYHPFKILTGNAASPILDSCYYDPITTLYFKSKQECEDYHSQSIPYWLQYDVNPEIGNWHCSKCNGIILHENYSYCPHCGAKIKWRKK